MNSVNRVQNVCDVSIEKDISSAVNLCDEQILALILRSALL